MKLLRKKLPLKEKDKKDNIIFKKIISLEEFKKSDTILVYVSSSLEIDTLKIINYSLKLGKRVAVPRCIDNEQIMCFHYINSLNELKIGRYGIKEPDENCPLFENNDNSFCIVPALMIDKNNYRLGYGKGYYDRFLRDYKGTSCVVCYSNNITYKLPVYDNFDVKCDISVTD